MCPLNPGLRHLLMDSEPVIVGLKEMSRASGTTAEETLHHMSCTMVLQENRHRHHLVSSPELRSVGGSEVAHSKHSPADSAESS